MRLGFFPSYIRDNLSATRKRVWIHTVSVGEAVAAGKLISELKKQLPRIKFVISTITPTGNKIAKSIAQEDDVVIYLPLEFDLILKKAMAIINPLLFISVETEIWPKLINSLHRRNIPIVVVNGRISEASFKGYSMVKFFIRSVLERIDLFLMRSDTDAERIEKLGVDKSKIKVTGNIKFDIEPKPSDCSRQDLGISNDDLLILAGSTHNNEEETVIKIYRVFINNYKNLKLLIAPRHIERTSQVESIIKDADFKSVRISELANKKLENTSGVIYILNTVGQLSSLYSLADIVFMGGSLVSKGGQNILEPAVYGKPIIFGPNMQNFQDIAELFIKNNAAIQVKDRDQLEDELKRLIENVQKRGFLGECAQKLVAQNRGAVLKTVNLLRDYLK